MENKPQVKVELVPVELDTLLTQEYEEAGRKLLKLYESAPEILRQLESLLFISESIAHLKGLEKEILPTTENVRKFIETVKA